MMIDDYQRALASQHAASDPQSSVFVSANAGTGKTKVLTERVLRLLLAGAVPDAILCVTYTRAAAAEMTQRLNSRLARWAVCPETELLSELAGLGGGQPDQSQLAIARSLFASILDNENGPRIETMHSFCRSILSRFPIEAGVPSHFELASTPDLENLLVECFYQLAADRSEPMPGLFSYLAGQADERSLLDRLKDILGERALIEALAKDPAGIAGMEKFIFQTLGWSHPDDVAGRAAELAEWLAAPGPQGSGLAEIADQLLAGGKIQQGRARAIKGWLSRSAKSRQASLEHLTGLFFSGSNLKRLSDKSLAGQFPDLEARQQVIAEQIKAFATSAASAASARRSLALAELASRLFNLYQGAKWQRSWLDFDDLITLTDQLLGQDGVMDWVRWKLDNAIQHLLVDEAQDTSPAQWRLLDRLALPFFDEPPAPENPDRTLFVVGDFKQSIYRFQGASPAGFASQQEKFASHLSDRGRSLETQNFTRSFRSSAAVLSFVDVMMSDEDRRGMGQHWQQHEVHWSGQPGFVECWPITKMDNPPPPPPFLPPEGITDGGAAALQAEKVAAHIKGLLEDPSDDLLGRRLQAQDIMILLRKRDSFYALLRGALVRAGLPLAPADRVKMLNQIEILDLLALGDVCLLPEDDLQLAALLKSPLLGLDEADLLALAGGRGETSLFSRLLAHRSADSDIGRACDRLLGWIDQASQLAPFEFFARVLEADGGRFMLSSRLGPAVDDTLNSFLQMARDHGRSGRSALGYFLQDFRASKAEIKREMDDVQTGQIRMMTMHGAKGLEAPVIYLPDMLRPRQIARHIYERAGYPFWPASSEFLPEFLEEAKQEHKQAEAEEEDRLLYVALTRARQGLVIAGWQADRRRMPENSWYEGLRDRLEALPGTKILEDGRMQIITKGDPDGPVPRLAAAGETAKPDSILPPAWLDKTPPAIPRPPRPLRPSASGPKQRLLASPLGHDARIARQKGQIMHRLLDLLGGLDKPGRQRATGRFWQARPQLAKELDSRQIDQQLEQLFSNPQLAPLFGPEALSEAALSGQVAGRAVAGQADRLVVLPDRVLLADFKTGQPPPDGQPPEDYITQLALYAALAEQIWPELACDCWLVWTATAQSQLISKAARKAAIDRLEAGLAGTG